jgi:pSer/pThr/pTyr-binding forkhead associated (FHA) protein
MSIGRASRDNSTKSDLDLAVLTADPAVSHRGRMSQTTDGTWEVLDLGSENGTMCNGQAVRNDVATALDNGDVIVVGAWTRSRCAAATDGSAFSRSSPKGLGRVWRSRFRR